MCRAGGPHRGRDYYPSLQVSTDSVKNHNVWSPTPPRRRHTGA